MSNFHPRQKKDNPLELLKLGCEILRQEGDAISTLAGQLDSEFAAAINLILQIRGNVVITGMGKAGLIGQKISATMASTGTASHFVHPGEALHGDLGRFNTNDLVLALSHSGETEEVVSLLPSLTEREIPIIAMTGKSESTLAKSATCVLSIGKIQEADSLGLAPSSSTTVMLALGDALALVTSRQRGFVADDFAKLHPAGSLGQKLAKVDDLMRPLNQCRCDRDNQTLRRILIQQGKPGRRTGAILLTDDSGCLCGIFTDSDLARILEREQDSSLDAPVSQVMTKSPSTVVSGTLMSEALHIIVHRKISELPVVDSNHRPIGIIDITDVVGLVPAEQSNQLASETHGNHQETSNRLQNSA